MTTPTQPAAETMTVDLTNAKVGTHATYRSGQHTEIVWIDDKPLMNKWRSGDRWNHFRDGRVFEDRESEWDIVWIAGMPSKPVPAADVATVTHVLRQIMQDLPSRRDWLDPELEAVARRITGQASVPASPAPSRATSYRDALQRIADNPSGFDAAGLSEFAETTLALVDSVADVSRDSGRDAFAQGIAAAVAFHKAEEQAWLKEAQRHARPTGNSPCMDRDMIRANLHAASATKIAALAASPVDDDDDECADDYEDRVARDLASVIDDMIAEGDATEAPAQ